MSNPTPHINQLTILNAVTGFPLSHTLSPKIHAEMYAQLGINAVMLAFPSQNIEEIITCMRTLPIHLLAVTIPHKQTVMKFLDHIDSVAKKIGAVNTVINRNGKLHGYNTDVVGIAHALKNTRLKGKNVLILGAGGAARPLCWFLKKSGAKIFCLNRTRTKAEELTKKFGGTALDNKALVGAKIDVIINATPVGMKPNVNKSPFPKSLLNKTQTVFDLIYNPEETKLLKDAKNAGAKTINGMLMFVAQAIEQVRLWSGKKRFAPQNTKIINC